MSVLAAGAAEAVVPCPDVPPYSQHRLSLALASRRLRSRFQHWTALTIDHHLALDTLVMRRSTVSDDRRLRTKMSNIASADRCTDMDCPGRS